ncbi:hypothetical protein AA313_de0200389 [Arthrobotrys entomopaga]|nr:hypothetical protein AA313_de0200389 [Arthrobotrys entomopaga]
MVSVSTIPRAIPPRVISEEWHNSLLTNFRATREAILTTPLEEAETPFPDIPTEWRDFMVSNQPSLPILQSITSENAIKALKHIRKNVGWVNVHEWQGKWIWALLARANDVGILMNEEVSVIRELGKKAVFNLGKAADAREKIVEGGGKDWWDEELQERIREYMNGGGQTEEIDDGALNINVEQWDGGVKLDDQVELPVEEAAGEEKEVERPVKKLALFKPRAIALATATEGPTLSVPAIAILPATPELDKVDDPMEGSLTPGQLLPETLGVTNDDQLASAQLQQEQEIGPSASSNTAEEKMGDAAQEGARETEEANFTPRVPDVKTIFALDMIVSVVGDAFGQRDLLLERR